MRQIWRWFWPQRATSSVAPDETPCPSCDGTLAACQACEGDWQTGPCRHCGLGLLCDSCGIHHWIG